MSRTKFYRRHAPRRVAGVAAVAVSAMLLTAGCQSSTTDNKESSAGDSAIVGEAKAAVAKGSEEVGSGVPSSSPAALKGKSVVLIPCAQAGEGCAQPALGAKAAAETLGWKVTLIDGKGTADGQSSAIRQAISLKPDGIVTFAIDPASVKGSIKAARDAGIKIIASSSPPSDLVDFADNPTAESWKDSGTLAANYLIAKTEGKAKVVLLTDTEFAAVNQRTEAFAARIEECSSCTLLETKNFNFADLGTGLPQIAQQVAQKYSDLDAIMAPYDAAVPPVLQGLKARGGVDTMVLSGDGTSESLACIREDCGQTATVAFALDWIGWSDIDALNRLLQNEDPAPAAATVPIKLITADNVQSDPGTWSGDLDFTSLYKKLWNVG